MSDQAPTDPATAATLPRPWGPLVLRIQQGDQRAMEELYQTFARGIRFYLCRQLGPQELDDKVHDTYLIVVEAIRNGELREPDRLMGFVRTIVRRQVAAYINDMVQAKREEIPREATESVPDVRVNPEQDAAILQKVALMKSILLGLGARDREILTRFYLYEESSEKICQDMSLSENQFRLLKSRAKAKLCALGRRKLKRSKLMQVFLKASAAGSR